MARRDCGLSRMRRRARATALRRHGVQALLRPYPPRKRRPSDRVSEGRKPE